MAKRLFTMIILPLVILQGCDGNGNDDNGSVVGPDELPTGAGSDADPGANGSAPVPGEDVAENQISIGTAALFLSLSLEARPRNLWVKGPGFSDGYWGG